MRRRKYSDEYRHYKHVYSPDINPFEQIARTALELQKFLGVDSFDTKYSDSVSRSNDNSWYEKYYSLCVSNISHRLSDSDIRDAIYHECKHLGDFNVKLSSYNGQRVAYINFRSSRYAAKAYNSLKNFKLDSKLIHLEPLSQNSFYSRSPRIVRSRSPPLTYNHDNYISNNNRSNDSYSPARYNRHRSRSTSRFSNKINNKDHKSNYSTIKDTTVIPTRTLFVGNLPCNITESDLKNLFGKFGDITDIDIKKPTSNRQGNSYAFIKFENLDVANQAKNEMSGHLIGKCHIKIGFGKVNPTNCVWVGGLGPWILYDVFEKEMIRFGIVKQIDWPQKKNYAYVLYESVDIAITAVNKLRGSHFGDETKPIKVDFADANVIKTSSYTNPKSVVIENESMKHFDLLKKSSSSSAATSATATVTATKESANAIISPMTMKCVTSSSSVNDELSVKSSKSISQLISCLNDVWTGMIVLKNNNFGCRLYMLKGEQSLINELMLSPQSSNSVGSDKANIDNLTITQRMKLDVQKLAEMSQRIESAGENGFCLMLASSYIVDTKLVSDSSQPQRPLKNLITYLRTKESAGVIFLKSHNSTSNGSSSDKNSSGVLHAFPPCDFSFDILLHKAPNLTKDFSKDDFLVILLIRNSS